MPILDDTIKKHIEESTGMSFDEIVNSDWETIDKNIEKKIGKKLKHGSIGGDVMYSRGTPYITLGRVMSLSSAEKELKKLRSKR